jgi:hypothetical protein
MNYWPIATGVFTIAVACVASAQHAPGKSVVGIVIARGSGEPLAHSIVALPALGRERFATDSGVFSFAELPSGPMALRVRRLGYVMQDTIVTIGAQSSDTIRIELTRVALQLGGITVSAPPPCVNPGPVSARADATLSVILNQVRLNAEQYRMLTEQYPFDYTMDIIRSSRLKTDGQTRIDSRRSFRYQAAKANWKYRPGRVVTRRGVDYMLHIPTLVDFADKDFLAHHCFHFAGNARVEDEDLIRVDVVASERIRDPDVNGTIYLDARTFQVRRTVFRLSRVTKQIRPTTDFEITTDFREILPSIPLISTVQSVERLDPDTEIAFDVAWETQKLAGFEFLKGKPGEDVRKKP